MYQNRHNFEVAPKLTTAATNLLIDLRGTHYVNPPCPSQRTQQVNVDPRSYEDSNDLERRRATYFDPARIGQKGHQGHLNHQRRHVYDDSYEPGHRGSRY